MAAVPRKKKANGFVMPAPLPKGEVLVDLFKKKWKLGISIGKGGFGEIYSAEEVASKNSNYVIKIVILINTLINEFLYWFNAFKEPHENGPLFVEMHFYMRNAKQTDSKLS